MTIPNPSGSGVGQNLLSGLQGRNQRNLLEIFKAATPVMGEIAKVKPETWRSMTGLFTALEGTFGVSKIGGALLRPAQVLQNRFMNTIEGFLAPVMVGLNNISNQVESFAMANQKGATVGAVVGFVASFALPGGALLWSMIGAGIGAGLEATRNEEWGVYGEDWTYSGGRRIRLTPADPLLQESVLEGPIVPIPQYAQTFPGGQFNVPSSLLSTRAQRGLRLFG